MLTLKVQSKQGCKHGGLDSSVLEAAHFFFLPIFEVERLHINLDVMAGHLFFVALCQDGSLPGVARQAVNAVSQEYISHTNLRDGDGVVMFQVPLEETSIAKIAALKYHSVKQLKIMTIKSVRRLEGKRESR